MTSNNVSGVNCCEKKVVDISRRNEQQTRWTNHAVRDRHLNKGLSYTIQERQMLGIHGLLPPVVLSQKDEAMVVLLNFKRCSTDLDRYIYIMDLLERNVKLFYYVVINNIELMMPIIYTPTVGLACQNFGLIFRNPQGLYITIHDAGHVFEVLQNWPEKNVKAIVVTDGERILGLGDLGSYGMGIPIGKLALYTACAGIAPQVCLPVMLDVGTNNQSLLEDPLYIGLRQKRTTGDIYDKFVEEFMQSVVRRFGENTLIQFEDFGNHNAFHFLEKYRDQYCTFNDDIQGTASVVVAGLLGSLHMTGNRLSDHTYVFQGAGEAAIGIAKLLVLAMQEEGISASDAVHKIWMVDSKGLIVKNRPSGGLTSVKAMFAKEHAPIDTLEDVVATVKPTALIGVAAVAGAFTENIIVNMGRYNRQPIIFALSNPTSKAECTAEQAYRLTEGRCIFSSGSPFDPVTVRQKTYYPGQGNNAYIFPGLGLAVILCQVHHIPDTAFLKAAHVLAGQVSKCDTDVGRVYPSLKDIREVSVRIAIELVQYFYSIGLATLKPEPSDKEIFVRSQLYRTDYDPVIPNTHAWPAEPVH
jgi:malate dehydrogenase (oxaloacetate-decarboxylating)(NADP+)